MASYRYERDIDPKDIAPRKERQYTRKEFILHSAGGVLLR